MRTSEQELVGEQELGLDEAGLDEAGLDEAGLELPDRQVVSQNKVLVLAETAALALNSREMAAAKGYRSTWTFETITPLEWRSKSAEQLMVYRAILVAEPTTCVPNTAVFQALADTRETWGAIMDGRVSLISTNPVSNLTTTVINNSVRFVMDTTQRFTGFHMALGCGYKDAPADTVVEMLQPFGPFKVEGVPGCGAAAHPFTSSSSILTTGLSDTSFNGSTGCIARSVFTKYPDHTFSFVAVAVPNATKPVPGTQTYIDYLKGPTPVNYVGTPFWVVRGASPRAGGCGLSQIPPYETCDLGDGINGVPWTGQTSSTCSWSCHLDWCGDGVVNEDQGEECDLGQYNGRSNDAAGNLSTCNGFCQIVDLPAPPNLPPNMVCKNVTVQATNTCGVAADINNGSFDPEGGTLNCVQDPPGPYDLGTGTSKTTLVTLTCTDDQNQSAACQGNVTVQDKVLPEVTLLPQPDPNQTLECAMSAGYSDPGATASDLCSGDLSAGSVARTGTVAMGTPNTYTLSYIATDPAGNKSPAKTRTVVVSDTQPPTLTLTGLANAGLECGVPFSEPGWSTSDACMGPINDRVVVTGSVNEFTLGTQTLAYNVADTSGNAAPERTRIVTVSDTLKPSVSMQGPTTQTVECNDPNYVDPGATATDSCVGALPAVADPPLNIGAPGVQAIKYKATDPSGNTGFTSGSRTVTVNDTLSPSVTLNGEASVGMECATAFTDPGATANDQCAGVLPVSVSGTVDNKKVGEVQTLTYSANDGRGHVGSAQRTVTVSDTLKPTVTPNGSLSQQVECGDPTYADPGATASDACAGVLTATAVTSANPGAPGNYVINYEATDPSGNKGTSTTGRTVTVSDTLAPELTMLGAANPKLECGTPFSDPGATANDQCVGPVQVTTTGSVTHQVPGDYTLQYKADDGHGFIATKERTVTVQDTLAPDVTVTGELAQTVECGSAYADPGATASDACAGALPAVPVNPADPGVPGDYAVQYKATDPAGNTGFSSSKRSVTVQDTLAPDLTLLGQTPQSLECGTPWADPGATASDQCAGNLNALITKSGGVNHQQPNSYTVTYSVNDGQGHTDSADRVVNVSDSLRPDIVVTGDPEISFECGNTYVDEGATATDACAGSLPVTIVQSADASQPGDITISYWAQDPSGNRRDVVGARTVHVNDNLAPTLALVGPATVGHECADPYNDQGATADDACFGDVSNLIQKTGSVDIMQPAPYVLTYTVTDPAGKSAAPVQRTVTVSDTKKPTVTPIGSLTQQVECGDPTYADQGATASDACAGPLTAVATTSANPGAPGNYVINYEATDPSGNKGTSTTGRTVTVSDTLAPSLALKGQATMGLECATPFADPGATASDQCAGDLSGAITKTGSVNNMQPATYQLTYNVTDPSGLSAPAVQRSVTVSDTLMPDIVVNGPPEVTFECGDTYVDQGATASDACAGSLPVTITQTGDPDQPGDILVSYSAKDPSNNERVLVGARTVHVNDNEAPTLALLGPATDGIECGSTYVDPGATANDACFGDLTAAITKSGAVDPAVPGPYTVTYNVKDPAGLSAAPVSRAVTVSDTVPPTITVLGPLSETFQCGTGPYLDPGATASDTCAGDLTAAIQRIGSVDTGAAGNYSLTYTVKDPSNNSTTSSQARTVKVTDDLPPSIQLVGSANPSLECGTAFVDLGATANDACAGDLTAAISKSGAVNSGTPGSYDITYTVSDPSNHTASTVRTVDVEDTLAPTLALSGANPLPVECAPTYQDPGATATDACEGNLDSRIAHNLADSATPGDYTVTYTVSDLSGNAATPLDRAVQVRDTLKPDITVLGPLETSFECGSAYVDPGATASDQCAGPLTVNIVQTGNPNQPGDMTISFWAQDPSGNRRDADVTRTVHVNDNEKPVLALVGPAVQQLECGSPYVDPGATANDACVGDLTASITTSGSVVSGTPADYTLIYNVTDTAGNSAASVSRQVQVRDTVKPTISVLGPSTTTYECGGTYTDPGATASDTCAGDLTAAIVATQTPDPGAPANFTVSYSVTDPSGNTTVAASARTVTMNDNLPPQISLVGPNNQVLECSQSQYNDPGASAIDQCVGSVPVQVVGTVNMSKSGLYTLQYSAKDTAGNTSPTLTRNVTVTDTTGPAITLNGENAIYLECKVGEYQELGATANDICSGPAQVTIDASAINPDEKGPYLVHYSATDLSGNTNTTVRNVIVDDTLPPTMALLGPNPMTMECATPFVDPGATATDLCEGEVSDTVFVEFNGIKNKEVGSYIVRYQGDDRFGHTVQKERNVNVVDTTPPVLTVTGAPSAEIECGTQPDLGVQATDSCYGILPASSIVATPAQLPNEPGEYDVTYSVTDPAGNTTTNGASRHFTVVDTGEPTLVLNGPAELYYECTGHAIGNVWSNPGASASDVCEGELQVHQYNSGDDDGDGMPGCDPETPEMPCDPDDFGPGPTTETEGLYYVQYLAWDETFNVQGKILSVYVQDTLPPVLSINGQESVQTQCFLPTDDPTDPDKIVEVDPDPYIDMGAFGDDQCYGDVTPSVMTFGEVNKQAPAVYTIEYQVRDGAFNWATPITRAVEVIDTIAPKLKDKGPVILPSADGSMRTVELSQCAIAWDLCEGYMDINARASDLVITSNDDNMDPGDIVILDNSTFQVRARNSTDGGARVYTASYTIADYSGQMQSGTCILSVDAPVVLTPTAGSTIKNTTPVYSGKAEAGRTVTIKVDDVPVGTATASIELETLGEWSFTSVVPLTDGEHTVKAYSTDTLGIDSVDSLEIEFTVDTTPPDAPVVVTPANGLVTNDSTPTYSGTAEAGSTVTVLVDGTAVGVTQADATSGVWSVTQGTTLANGSHTVKAWARDMVGNTSADSVTNTFTVDPAAPVAPVDKTPAKDSIRNSYTSVSSDREPSTPLGEASRLRASR